MVARTAQRTAIPTSIRVQRSRVAAVAVAIGALFLSSASAQTYPDKPIKLVLPFGAGSPPDTVGRLIAQQLSARLGQGVVIENRPGAGTTIANKAVAAADPDGYTLLQVNSALAYGQLLYPGAGYDPVGSFAPVAALADWSLLLVVNADVPSNTMEELITYAKSSPGTVNIGHTLGSPPQVLAEMFKLASAAPFNTVSYRLVPQLTTDLLGGRIQAYFGAGGGLIELVRQGKLKAIAYCGASRHPNLPDVPTVAESGFPALAFNPTDWIGIVAPARTPSRVIDVLNAAITESLNAPDVRTAIRREGAEPKTMSPSEFGTFLAIEAAKWPKLFEQAGLKPN